MPSSRPIVLAVAARALLLLLPLTAAAQPVPDHLKCYKIKDPLKLAGFVDLNGPQYGLEPDCEISRARLFCVPVVKTVLSAFDISTKPPTPISPIPVNGPNPGDRICYRIKCPTGPALSQIVTDQFGTRGLSGFGKDSQFRAFMLCTPAVKGSACGLDAQGVCGGACADPDAICTQPPGDVCGCHAQCIPCSQGVFPTCGGGCPAGLSCLPDPVIPVCSCQ